MYIYIINVHIHIHIEIVLDSCQFEVMTEPLPPSKGGLSYQLDFKFQWLNSPLGGVM